MYKMNETRLYEVLLGVRKTNRQKFEKRDILLEGGGVDGTEVDFFCAFFLE